MISSRAIVWTMCIVCFLSGSLYLAQAQTQPPAKAAFSPPPLKPRNDVHHLMEGQEAVFNHIKAAVKDAKWPVARDTTFALMELANVNTQHAKEQAYVDFAVDMGKQCQKLAEILKKKNAEEAKAGLAAVAASCKACHDRYQK